MTKSALTLYDKIRDLIEKESYVISSEQGFPDSCMYFTAWTRNTRVQVNVNNTMKPPLKLHRQLGLN